MPPKSDIPQQMETEGDPDVEITSKFSDEFDIDALLKEVVENTPEAMEVMKITLSIELFNKWSGHI